MGGFALMESVNAAKCFMEMSVNTKLFQMVLSLSCFFFLLLDLLQLELPCFIKEIIIEMK